MKKINHSDQANDISHLQVELPLNISAPRQVYTPHPTWDSLENTDPYWDELEQEQSTEIAVELLYVSIAPAEPQFVQEQFFTGDNESCNFTGHHLDGTLAHQHRHTVGEQVSLVTQKFAHQHEEPTHWIEKYWVERGHNKYWYFRYTWMAGRKLNRVYLGSVRSPLVQQKVEQVREAIALGKSPLEIKQLISSPVG